MAALPAAVPVGCPICSTPVDLPLSAGRHARVDEHLVMSLSVDTEPLTVHVAATHPAAVATDIRPGEVSTRGQVVVNVIRAPQDDGAFARGLARGAAEASRLMPPHGRR